MLGRNPWLAIDAATPPTQRALEVRAAWERFVGDGELGAVRVPIADSWRRSRAAGIDPSAAHGAVVVADSQETSARWQEHPLATAVPLIRDCLGAVAEASEQLIVVSDAAGLLLWIEGDAAIRTRAADTMNFAEGSIWSEGGAGTNAIGTALADDHAVQVFAAEHFNEVVQQWSCSAAPIHDPDSGELLGAVDLTGVMGGIHPGSFGSAVAAARAVELYLRGAMEERDRQLLADYQDRVAGTPDHRALVTSTGRVLAGNVPGLTGSERLVLPPGGGELILPSGVRAVAEPTGNAAAFVVRSRGRRRAHRPALVLTLLGHDSGTVEIDGCPSRISRRQAEILALLSAHPVGMTAEQLAAELYGDAGQPGTVRVQVFRLRKLLGRWIDTYPYRLSTDVESDVSRVQSLLERGATRQAAEGYPGPLLPHSEAPGVTRERAALESWLRQAIMTAEDPEAVWAWVQCPSGADDLPAWKRLLANLDYRDPRRSLAAARLGALRAAYA